MSSKFRHTDLIYVYSCCQVSIGSSRSLIIDLQRNKFLFIPNILAEIIAESKGKIHVIDTLSKIECEENKIIFKEYMGYLLDNELAEIIEIEEAVYFENLDLNFESPETISNCILDIGPILKLKLSDIVSALNDFNCVALEIRSFESLTSLELIEEIFNGFINSTIRSIDLTIKYFDGVGNSLNRLIDLYPKINNVIIFNSPEGKVERHSYNTGFTIYCDFPAINSSSCGVVHWNYFVPNIEHFIESKSYNSCLYKKIGIDVEGNIKNCPSMKESFGNIKNTTLQEAINKPGFKKHWNIKKDNINICKDCEFRHICTDCRAYIEDPGDLYSKPLKCGYNPYTNEWEEWSTHPMKQKAIEFYELKDLQ